MKIAAPFIKRGMRVVRQNLNTAFDGKPPFKLVPFYERVLANFSRAVFDLIYASWHWTACVPELFDEEELDAALNHADRIRAENGGVLVVSGHIGSWELLGAALALRMDTKAVARSIAFAPYNDAVMDVRSRLGYGIFFQDDPITQMAKHVRSGGLLGLIADQDIAHNAGIFVPFFGVEAYTPTGPAALSMLAKAPILPIFCIYEGGRYRLKIFDPIFPPERRSEESIYEITVKWQAAVEEAVRRWPDQWAWFHKRWKTRPQGKKEGE